MKRIIDFIKQNSVLLKFYLFFGYFSLLFYFFLHWKITEKYIAVNLPILMAKSVALMLHLFGYNAEAVHTQVRLPGFSFTIIYHCAGVFGMMIYAAAVLAYPSKFYEKLYGFVVGFLGLYTINTIRMAVLGIIGLKWRKHFDFYHEYLWQGIFIIFVIGFWVLWKEKLIRQPESSPSESGSADEKNNSA